MSCDKRPLLLGIVVWWANAREDPTNDSLSSDPEYARVCRTKPALGLKHTFICTYCLEFYCCKNIDDVS